MKMKMKNIFIGMAVALTSVFSYGQIDRSKAPVPGAAPEINIADPVVFDLDNGMKVILSTNNKIPKVSRSEEHTSELQSRPHLVCRLLLEKKNHTKTPL